VSADPPAALPVAEFGRVAITGAPSLRGLPLFDVEELERATGFVWIVRSFVTLPLTGLGVLATIASVIVGNLPAAAFSIAITVLIVLSLHRDTQFSKAIELLRRGELAAAEGSLRRIVERTSRAVPQRQRARSYLAGIAWMRGDLEVALQWTRAWLEADTTSSAADERYLFAASEVQLLALLGEHDEAEARLERLPERPRGDRGAMADATCRLLVAFCRGEVEPVRGELDAWVRLFDRADDHGLPTGLLAWAHDAVGMTERAVALVHRARESSLQRQAPALAQWLGAYDDRALRYR
jgi:tetratricopeptide (TPR) repeat protein